MTEGNPFVTVSIPTRPGTIAPDLALTSPPDGRTFRRRRLGLLTGILAATLAFGGLVAGGGGSSGTSLVAAGASADGGVVVGESSGSVTLAAVFEETTNTLLAVTTTTLAGSTTTTAAPTTTTEPPATTSMASPSTTTTSTEPAEEAPSTSAAASTTPETTSAPPTTSPPTTAPPTTAAPTTTAAPASSDGSGYSDPNTLQVWLDLAQCESGGNWSINSGNGYYGGLQFSLGTWESVGGTGYPHEHGRDTQIEMGRRLQARAGWDAWPHCAEKLGLR